MAVQGIPVVIATNGKGVPVRQVQPGDLNYGRAPLMTVATNGFGMPIVLSDLGAPARVEGGGGRIGLLGKQDGGGYLPILVKLTDGGYVPLSGKVA